MLPKHLIEEIKNEFKDNVLVVRFIDNFFDKNSTYLKPVIDNFVEGRKIGLLVLYHLTLMEMDFMMG